MTIPSFDLLRPTSIREACQLLLDLGDDARPIAGGTTLVILMKQRALRFSHLIDLQAIPGLDGIDEVDGQTRIGALATHRSVELSPLVRGHIPVLAQAFGRVGNVRVRETASVGGNLAHADYRLDPPPALMILGAEVAVASVHATRTLAVKDLYRGMYETALDPGEIITEVRVPAMPATARTRYTRYSSLAANDWPCLGIGALLCMEGQRTGELRLGLGGLAETPVLVQGLESFRDRPVSEELVDDVCKLVNEQIAPVSDLRGSSDYKRQMASIFIGRTLRELARRGRRG